MNKKSLIKYGVAALVLAAAAIAMVTVVSIKPMEKEEEGMGLTVDPYSGTYVATEKAETEEDSGGIAIPGWGSIRIKAGEKLVDVNLENPADNKDRYNMSFTLYLKGETEPLAETGLIQPGESALKLELSRPLEAGEYEATVHVQPYRLPDNSPTNNADIETILIVE